VEIVGPDLELATTDGRPTFEGTATDNQSGLQPDQLRLVISSPQMTPPGQAEGTGLSQGSPVTPTTTTNTAADMTTSVVPTVPTPGITSFETLGIAGIITVDFPDPEIARNNPIRILEGSEDGDAALYAEDTGYIDGQIDVAWSYRPPRGEGVVGGDITESFVPFTAYVQDLAGNVGYADSNPDEAGSQVHEFQLDRSDPGLVPFESNPLFITFATDIPGNPSQDVRVRTTRAAGAAREGQTQTGISWDSNEQALVPSQRAIMVSFDDRIVEAEPENFTVDFDTSGFSANIDDVIVPSGNITADIFTREVNNQDRNILASPGDADSPASNLNVLTRIIRQSVFLIFDRDIPSDDTPEVVVENVFDEAGNDLEEDSSDAHDGIGPVLTVELSDGTGQGVGANGPGGLTNDNITITVRSTEAQTRNSPEIELYRVTGTVGQANRPADIERTARQTSTGVWERIVDADEHGTWCVVVTHADDNQNSSSIGFVDCINEPQVTNGELVSGDLVDGGISFRYDERGPTSSRTSALVGDERTPRTTYNDQQPSVVITLREEVRPGTFDLRRAEDQASLAGQFTTTDNRAFVYRPSANLPFEALELEWRATDLAGNISTYEGFSITIVERTDFRLVLQPGWNLVSFPSVPVDPNINAVFSDSNITQVTTIDVPNFRNAATRTAIRSRANNMLMPSGSDGLTQVRAGGAYWVLVDTFQITLDVELTRPTTTSSPTAPALTTINAVPGMNFVGVVDQSAQQTQQDDAGGALIETPGNPNDILKTVGTYLSGVNQLRVYTYDNVNQRFTQLSDSDNLTIGEGLLVFIAPDSTGRVNPIIP